jgi:hypothetical protein
MGAEGDTDVGVVQTGNPDAANGECVVSMLGQECEGMGSGMEA